jgi:ZIP family zinc transporter
MTASRLWLVVPAALVALVVALILIWRPLDRLATSSPPVENAAIESTRLTSGMISLVLRTDGSLPVVVAQVQVDGAYREFTASPNLPSAWLGRTRIDIPYPWIEGEAHRIALITQTGMVIERTIEVALLTPQLSVGTLSLLALVGLLLGIVPVATGLLTWPAMRSISPAGMNFLLALTAGLLAFLLIDTIGEGLEAAGKTIERLNGVALFWVIFAPGARPPPWSSA